MLKKQQHTSSTERTDIQIPVYMLVVTLFLWILMQLSVNVHLFISDFKHMMKLQHYRSMWGY